MVEEGLGKDWERVAENFGRVRQGLKIVWQGLGRVRKGLGRGIEKYKSDGQEIPEYGFTPDSTFPLIYSERELWEFKIKGETTSDFEIKSGMALNVVPDKAIYTKDNNEISFEGKAAHAMHPWKGDNAIYKLLQNIDEKHELISFIKNEINFETNGKTLFGKLIKDENEQLSLNLALLKINENESQLGIDIRIPSTTNSLELETKIKKILKEKYPKLKFEHYDQLPGVNVSLESNWAKSMISSYQEITGDLETMPIATGGATYARSMDNIVAFGPFFNSSPNTEHQYNEHIKFEDLKKSFDIYELLIKKIL